MSTTCSLRPLATALISVMALQGCVTTQGPNGEKLSMGESFKQTFDNDDPCANSKRNVGIAIGVAAGAIVGSLVSGDKNKLVGAAIGALAGGGLGALIGHEIDYRQCEISKIQKKYGAEIQVMPLSVEASDPIVTSQDANGRQAALVSQPAQSIGLSVAVVDKDGKPQFASNSADIQPEASAMFSEIAQKYVAPKDEEGKKLAEAMKTRRVLLIGHTDDTGNSKLNAELSERRAKAVAKLFKDAGVPDSQLYYQGAGETLPIADNSTPEGQAKNRRVEIVDLNDEGSFNTYLENRRPNTAYYRPAEKPQQGAAVSDTHSAKTVTEAAVKKSKKSTIARTGKTVKPGNTVTAAATTASPQAKAAGKIIDFGGTPFSSGAAKVDAGKLVANSSPAFSLISEAHASDIGRIETCNVDRPRNAGLVKSLKDGSTYKTTDYLPGLYGRSWHDMVGDNLVVLNKVAVLRDGAMPANKPELKVYSNYRSAKKDPVPDLYLTPDVNTYQTSNGLLYRVFANGDRGVQCMDILMPMQNVQAAKDGKLVYGNGAEFVSDFKPKIKN